MNRNIVIGIVVAVVLVAGGIYWFVQSQSNMNTAPSPAPIVTPTENPSPSPSPTPAPAPSPVTHSVTIQNFAFGPTSIIVKKGDTVVWTNKDSMGHTVTGKNGGPSSPTIGTNGTYRYAFNSVGTFNYYCAIHPSMLGTVIVTE